MMTESTFLSGFAMATFLASAIFFLKSWRISKDQFYLWFCIAFTLLGIERLALLLSRDATSSPTMEAAVGVYLFRLGSFLLIVLAIVQKNNATQK